MTREELRQVYNRHQTEKSKEDLQEALGIALEFIDSLTEEVYDLTEELKLVEQDLKDAY